MTPTPEVTVLTAVRNGARYLDETVHSILRQSHRDWEYIIVDDASDDETPAILEGHRSRDDRIRVVRLEERAGPFAAANRGLSAARGRWIVRTDADDVSVEDRIERQLDYLRKHPELRACGSLWQLLSDSGELLQQPWTTPPSPSTFRWRLLVRGGPLHSTLCVERTALEELGRYREEAVAQDFRLLCDLSRRRWLGVVPEVLVYYRQHGGQLRATAADQQELAAHRVLRDHVDALGIRGWSDADLARLHGIGRRKTPLLRSLWLLHRWRSLWHRDASLSHVDRSHLTATGATVLRQLLYERLRDAVVVDWGRRLLGRARRTNP